MRNKIYTKTRLQPDPWARKEFLWGKEIRVPLVSFDLNKKNKKTHVSYYMLVYKKSSLLLFLLFLSSTAYNKNQNLDQYRTILLNSCNNSSFRAENQTEETCIQTTCCSKSQSGWPQFWSHPKGWVYFFFFGFYSLKRLLEFTQIYFSIITSRLHEWFGIFVFYYTWIPASNMVVCAGAEFLPRDDEDRRDTRAALSIGRGYFFLP